MQRTPPLPSGSDVSTQKRELSTIPAWASSRLVASNCGNVFTSIVGPVTGKEPRAADDIQGRGNRQNFGRPQKSKASTSRPSLASTFHSRRHLKDGARRRSIVSTRSAKSFMRRGWNSECLHRHCSDSDAFGTIARPSAANENRNPILSCVAAESGLPYTKPAWTPDRARRMH